MDAELRERALVDQERQPLARGELVLLVLARDPLLAAAQPGLLAALVQILDQRAQRRSGDERVGGSAFGGHEDSEMCSSTGSSTCIAVSVATARASSSSGASKFVISIPTSSQSSSTESIRS